MIYLDNAATTLHKPQCVAQAVTEAMTSIGNAARGVHPSSLQASRTVYGTREQLAAFFHCMRADHVIFTSNATEALNLAIQGVINPGDHVITTDLEHNSVLRPLYRLAREQQVELSFLPADQKGCIDPAAIEQAIRANTKAVICTHASNVTGNMTDLARIGAITKRNGLLLIADASQTAGCVPVDMEQMQIDILCFTGHKGLMGPQGTGGMCIREGVEVRPLKTGGTGVQSYLQEQPPEYPVHLEAGTLNGHGIAGLSAALDFISQTKLSVIMKKERKLAGMFYEGVCKVDGVKIYGDFSSGERAAVVALNIRDYGSGAVSDELAGKYGIATRPGAHCAPRMHQALGTVGQGIVRFSFSYFNTEEEVEQAVRAVKEIAAS